MLAQVTDRKAVRGLPVCRDASLVADGQQGAEGFRLVADGGGDQFCRYNRLRRSSRDA